MDLVNTILIIGGLAIVVYALLLEASRIDEEDKPIHHDNRKGSHYYETHNSKKEDR